jgi:hypothetical protein
MSKRLISFLAVLSLLAAACNGTESTATTESDAEPTTSAPEVVTTEPAMEAVLLSYTLAAGDEFQYEVGLDQHIEVSTSGDASLLAEEELPGTAAVDITGSATFTHVVSDGPEPGTYEIHITGDFADVNVTGTVDGEPIDSGETPDFAALEPIDVTVIVDEQGNLIEANEANEAIDDPLSGMFGDLGALGGDSPAPGLDLGQFFGPQLSADEVTVGDTWTEEIETPGLSLTEEDSIITSITSTVTGVDSLDGADVFVIESQASTSPIEFDLAEFLAGMLGAFGPEETTEAESAEFEEMLSQLQFLISIDDTASDSTAWFDAEAGIVRQSEVEAGTTISMDINVPDEETGEMAGFQMDMAIDQSITYRLIDGPSA